MATTTEVTNLQSTTTLRDVVIETIQKYFANLGGAQPQDMYSLVMEEVESPLFEAVMRFTKNNQVRAAKLMGISRGTLRARLKKYGLISSRKNG